MTGWTTDKKSPPPTPQVTAAVDPAAVTSFSAYCDPFCIPFLRLHTIACDIANRRDPILDKKIEQVEPMVFEDAVRETPYREWDE